MRLGAVLLVALVVSTLQHPTQSRKVFQAASGTSLGEQLLQRYLTNEQLAAWMDEFVHKCANISRKFSIGKSVRGLDLWVLELSDRPGQEQPEPNFKYISNMHGNEPSGRVLLPQLAEWLCANNAKDERATRIIKSMRLFLVPTLNPDGFALRKRGNAFGIDLNRNFPDPVEVPSIKQMQQPLSHAAPETVAFMGWSLSTHFSAAASLHEGAVLANYPFDGYSDHGLRVNGTRHPAPDDATFLFLAKLYAAKHKFMAKSKSFPDGVTNGAAWYPVYGGMQDWDYLAAGCLDITLELSEDKWRPEAHLPQLWEENRDALLALPLAAVLGGVSGTVVSAANGSALPAVVMVQGIDWNTSAHPPFGFYQRPLAPGSYNLTAVLDGYVPSTAAVTVPADGSGAVQDFKLQLAGAAPPPIAPQEPAAAAKDSSGSGSGSSSSGSGSSSSGSGSSGSSDTIDSGMGHLSVSTKLAKFVGRAAAVRRQADGFALAVLGLAVCLLGAVAVCWTAGVQMSSSSRSQQ